MDRESKCCNRIYYFLNINFLKNSQINNLLLKNYNKCLSLKNLGNKFDKNCKKKIDIFEINIEAKDKFKSEIAKKSFIEELKCINNDVLKFIKKINSVDANSIVVIQSDNAIPSLEFPLGFYNINFWKLPPSCEHMFKNNISNVNTFRIIFNCIGAGNWDLQENELIIYLT